MVTGPSRRKPTCFAIHTERLHDDAVWARARRFADFLFRRSLAAVWFSINPTASAYRSMGYDEAAWAARLRYLAAHGQRIEQHTHFYGDRKGVYGLSLSHMRARLREDRAWLAGNGHAVTGIVSGAWIVFPELLALLAEEGYSYDCSSRTFSLPYIRSSEHRMLSPSPRRYGSLWEIPTTHQLKHFWLPRPAPYRLAYCHDYDLARVPFRMAAYVMAAARPPASFVTPPECL